MNDLNDTPAPSQVASRAVSSGLERISGPLDTQPKTKPVEAMKSAFVKAIRLLPPGTVLQKKDVYYEAE